MKGDPLEVDVDDDVTSDFYDVDAERQRRHAKRPAVKGKSALGRGLTRARKDKKKKKTPSKEEKKPKKTKTKWPPAVSLIPHPLQKKRKRKFHFIADDAIYWFSWALLGFYWVSTGFDWVILISTRLNWA